MTDTPTLWTKMCNNSSVFDILSILGRTGAADALGEDELFEAGQVGGASDRAAAF